MTPNKTRLAAPAEAMPSAPLRILVVDEHAVNQQLWLHLLRQMGHKVQAVHDGDEAIETAEQFKFDVVFIDLDSPETNGFHTSAQIRQRAGGDLERPWIIGYTVAISSPDTDRAMGAGINDLMIKSGRHDDLANAMQTAARALQTPRSSTHAA